MSSDVSCVHFLGYPTVRVIHEFIGYSSNFPDTVNSKFSIIVIYEKLSSLPKKSLYFRYETWIYDGLYLLHVKVLLYNPYLYGIHWKSVFISSDYSGTR